MQQQWMQLLCCASCLRFSLAAPPQASVRAGGTSTLAMLGVVAQRDAGVKPAIGTVRKHPANPLFGKTEPWEEDINNGYPTVLYDPADPLGTYRCWYDDHSQSALAYANSSDGITWTKPILGIINISGMPCHSGHTNGPCSNAGTQNNLVVAGNGIGVMRDHTVPHGSPAAFKGFGQLGRPNRLMNHGGTLISADGLHWNSPEIYDWPDPPQRYDTACNIFYDDARRQHLLQSIYIIICIASLCVPLCACLLLGICFTYMLSGAGT